MFIYGSFARGEAGAGSDIDLFIVGEVDEDRLITVLQETEDQLSPLQGGGDGAAEADQEGPG